MHNLSATSIKGRANEDSDVGASLCIDARGAQLGGHAVTGRRSVVPQVLPDPGDVPLLGLITGTFDFGTGAAHLTGTYEQGVFVDVFGLTCAGCLDFYVGMTVDPFLATGISNIGMDIPFKFTTNVGYVAGDSDKTPLLVAATPSDGVLRIFQRQGRLLAHHWAGPILCGVGRCNECDRV